MMEVDVGLQAHAAVDLATKGDIAQALDTLRHEMRTASNPNVVDIQSSYDVSKGHGIAPASGVLDLVIRAPRKGFIWELRTLIIVDPTAVDPVAAFPGDVALYVGGNTGQVNPFGIRGMFASLPTIGEWGEGKIRFTPEQNLVCRINGANSGQNLIATGSVQLYDAQEYMTSRMTREG